jgi:dihydroorotase
MGELAALGAAGFTDDGHPVGSANVMRHALQYSAVAGLRLALHEEETTLTRDGHMHEGAVSAELGLGGWPSIGESLMIARDIALAAYEGQPIHVMHISCAESVELIRRAQRDGVGVTAEVSPHHLCLTDEAVRSLDTNTKMNPPLRSEADRQALIAGLLDGTISSIATDHAPHALHEKETPFEEAPFGVIGLETAFAVLWTRLIEPGHVPLETVLAAMSAGPARTFDLAVPRIAVGEPANIVAIDLAARWMVAADGIRSRSTNSWLLGATLLGKVVRTIADGVEVFAA